MPKAKTKKVDQEFSDKELSECPKGYPPEKWEKRDIGGRIGYLRCMKLSKEAQNKGGKK